MISGRLGTQAERGFVTSPGGNCLAILAAVAALVVCSPAPAQETDRGDYRIVLVTWRGSEAGVQGFRDHFQRRRIPAAFLQLSAADSGVRLSQLAGQIRALEPDLVYTWGSVATQAVVGRFSQTGGEFVADIPVVFAGVAYPVGSGLVPSLQSSQRNLTGSEFLAPAAAQLRAIYSYRRFHKLAVIYNPADQDARLTVSGLRRLEQQFDYQLLELPLALDSSGRPDIADLPRLLSWAAEAEAEFIYLPPDDFLERHRRAIGDLALLHRLPTFAASEAMLQDSSVMMGIVVSRASIGQLAAVQAERILVNRERAQDLPIQSFTDYSLVLNMQTISDLGFYPPVQLLGLAETVR